MLMRIVFTTQMGVRDTGMILLAFFVIFNALKLVKSHDISGEQLSCKPPSECALEWVRSQNVLLQTIQDLRSEIESIKSEFALTFGTLASQSASINSLVDDFDSLELSLSETETGLSTLANDVTAIDAKISAANLEHTYERWGRTVCPAGDDLVYVGMVAGSNNGHSGGTSDLLCVPVGEVLSTPTASYHSLVYYAELQTGSSELANSPFNHLYQAEVACSVCKTSGKDTIVIHGKAFEEYPCGQGFEERYRGYSMSSHHGSSGQTEMICVDKDLEFAGNIGDHNGCLLYHVASNNHGNAVDVQCVNCIWTCVVCTLK